MCGSLGFSATICSVLFLPPGVPEARGTANRVAIPGCPFCCLATGLGKRLGLRDYLRVSAPFPGAFPRSPPPLLRLVASSQRLFFQASDGNCFSRLRLPGLVSLSGVSLTKWWQALGSGSAVALVYRRKTSECLCVSFYRQVFLQASFHSL